MVCKSSIVLVISCYRINYSPNVLSLNKNNHLLSCTVTVSQKFWQVGLTEDLWWEAVTMSAGTAVRDAHSQGWQVKTGCWGRGSPSPPGPSLGLLIVHVLLRASRQTSLPKTWETQKRLIQGDKCCITSSNKLIPLIKLIWHRLP